MNNKSKMFFTIFTSIFLLLLVINVYLYLFNEDFSISFTTLFRKLEEMPRIDTSFIKLNFETGIVADWGVFNFAKDFINGIWQIIGVFLYVCVQIANVMVYIFRLLQALFIGVLG